MARGLRIGRRASTGHSTGRSTLSKMCTVPYRTKSPGTQQRVRRLLHSKRSPDTSPDCTLISPGNYTGIVGSTTCDHDYMSNTGCGIVDPSIASFGEMFNAKGGGVYAMKWDSYSIDVWFFYRTAIPNDILTGLPNPGTWPLPSASLSGLGCPIDTYFRNHMLIFGGWIPLSWDVF